ncbi:MAG: cupin domain-containing protein [Deltaproteobacteria bacterium]
MLFGRIETAGIIPEISGPAEGRLIAGAPVFTTWNIEDSDGLYAGVWQSTPGAWQIVYDEWEYCHILAGISVITSETGESWTVKAGDSFILRPGFRGTWEVVETTRKEYVIYL